MFEERNECLERLTSGGFPVKTGSCGGWSEGIFMAEREGFEPSRPFWGLRDFESRAFDHSAISPKYCPKEYTEFSFEE